MCLTATLGETNSRFSPKRPKAPKWVTNAALATARRKRKSSLGILLWGKRPSSYCPVCNRILIGEGPVPAPGHSCRGAPLALAAAALSCVLVCEHSLPRVRNSLASYRDLARGKREFFSDLSHSGARCRDAAILRKLFSFPWCTSQATSTTTTTQHNGLCPLRGMLFILQNGSAGGKGFWKLPPPPQLQGLKTQQLPVTDTGPPAISVHWAFTRLMVFYYFLGGL